MRKLITFTLALFTVLASFADLPAGYRDLRATDAAGERWVLADALFPVGENGWSNIDGAAVRVEPNGGVNGSPALRYERTDKNDYTLVSRAVALQSGHRYRFGGTIRNEGVEGAGGNVVLEVYDAQGNWLRNQDCPNSMESNSDWTEVTYIFNVPAEEKACTYVVHLYMPRGSTGCTWFDRVFVEELQPRWTLDQVFPTHNVLDSAGGKARFYSRLQGEFVLPEDADLTPEYEVELAWQLGDRTEVRNEPFRQGVIETDFGKLPEGKGNLRMRLFDRANKLLLAEIDRPVESYDRFGRASATSCVIDGRDRAIVGGKPFLPIGLYTGQLSREEIDLIAASPFNCVMSYGGMDLSFDWRKETPLDETLRQAQEVLDYLALRDVKLILTLKDVYRSNPNGPDDYEFRGMKGADAVAELYVNQFKDHPALLAWYSCDERMVDWLPLMTARRALINGLDKNHPVWGVFYQPNVEDYLPMLDLFGGDQYPISRISEGFDHHMTSIDRLMGYAEATGVPTWNVPQAHNLNIYAPSESADDYRDPTADEMLSLSLVQAIHGGKAFIFYSFFDFPRGAAGAMRPELFEERWQNACMAAAELEKLAPFLLSATDAPEVRLSEVNGKLRARCFADDHGNYRLLIAGVGPGETSGVLEVALPEGLQFHSRSGNTERLGDGKFRFSGKDICNDIVALEPTRK